MRLIESFTGFTKYLVKICFLKEDHFKFWMRVQWGKKSILEYGDEEDILSQILVNVKPRSDSVADVQVLSFRYIGYIAQLSLGWSPTKFINFFSFFKLCIILIT